MDKKGLILSILAILAVFGLLMLGFLLYPEYRYYKAKKAFIAGDAESVQILLTRPDDFKRFFESEIERSSDEKDVLLCDTYFNAWEADPSIPELEDISEYAFVSAWYADFSTHKCVDAKIVLGFAMKYYPRFGLEKRLINTMLEDKEPVNRFLAAVEILKRSDNETKAYVFLKQLEKETDEDVLNAIGVALENDPDARQKAFKILLKRLEKKITKPLVQTLVAVGGKRELYTVMPDMMLKITPDIKTSTFDDRLVSFGTIMCEALSEPETVLFLDNGVRIVGEVLNENASALTFLEWANPDRVITMTNTSFYRVERDIAAERNPWYDVWHEYYLLYSAYAGCRESPVVRHLRWLHFHQDRPEGRWDVGNFTKNCNENKIECDGTSKIHFDMGASALALLAFLDEGQTHHIGTFKRTVRRALDFLQKIQNKDGTFKEENSEFVPLGHILCTIAVAEAYAMSGDKRIKKTADKALVKMLKMQNTDGGWPVKTGEPSTATGTGFGVLAMRAAKASGLDVPEKAINKALEWFDAAASPDGSVAAVLPGDKGKTTILSSPRGRVAMLLCLRLLFGEDKHSDKLRPYAEKLKNDPPPLLPDGPGYYLDWYFGTAASFFLGGNYWKNWEIEMKYSLTNMRRRLTCAEGSWEPPPGEGPFNNRIAATALGALSLSFLNRYTRPPSGYSRKMAIHVRNKLLSLTNAPIDYYHPLDVIAAYRNGKHWDQRCRAVFLLGAKRGKAAGVVDFLKSALKDKDAFVRANAVRALVNAGAKGAREEIKKLKNDPSPFVRKMVKDALGKM
jgi:prenyltransferase beta subunit